MNLGSSRITKARELERKSRQLAQYESRLVVLEHDIRGHSTDERRVLYRIRKKVFELREEIYRWKALT